MLTEAELLVAIRNKERIGAEALYDMYSSALYGILIRMVQDEELGKDLLQETFVKIWNSIDSFDESKGRLFTWMVNIARNLAIDKLRSKDYRNNSKNQDIEQSGANEHWATGDLNPETLGVKEMVDNLKPESKAVLYLVYFKGYTHSEASKKLGIPLGTVKTRVRIAINALRKLFN